MDWSVHETNKSYIINKTSTFFSFFSLTINFTYCYWIIFCFQEPNCLKYQVFILQKHWPGPNQRFVCVLIVLPASLVFCFDCKRKFPGLSGSFHQQSICFCFHKPRRPCLISCMYTQVARRWRCWLASHYVPSAPAQGESLHTFWEFSVNHLYSLWLKNWGKCNG